MSAMDDVMRDVRDELVFALGRFDAFNSYHEGYAVILEELDELWAEVKFKGRERARLRGEAVQVAAMAVRFILDLCEDPA